MFEQISDENTWSLFLPESESELGDGSGSEGDPLSSPFRSLDDARALFTGGRCNVLQKIRFFYILYFFIKLVHAIELNSQSFQASKWTQKHHKSSLYEY